MAYWHFVLYFHNNFVSAIFTFNLLTNKLHNFVQNSILPTSFFFHRKNKKICIKSETGLAPSGDVALLDLWNRMALNWVLQTAVRNRKQFIYLIFPLILLSCCTLCFVFFYRENILTVTVFVWSSVKRLPCLFENGCTMHLENKVYKLQGNGCGM